MHISAVTFAFLNVLSIRKLLNALSSLSVRLIGQYIAIMLYIMTIYLYDYIFIPLSCPGELVDILQPSKI